jgi:hypothetical protein
MIFTASFPKLKVIFAGNVGSPSQKLVMLPSPAIPAPLVTGHPAADIHARIAGKGICRSRG